MRGKGDEPVTGELLRFYIGLRGSVYEIKRIPLASLAVDRIRPEGWHVGGFEQRR